MKAKNLLLTLIALSLVSCGGNKENTDGTGTEYIDPNVFACTVKLPDGTPVTGAKVRWCDENDVCYMPVEVNKYGTAIFEDGEDSSTYTVHLDLPSDLNYTYNPNIYTQTVSNKHMTITLTALQTPTSGNGEMYGGPYVIEEGVTRVEAKGLNSDNSINYTFYAFKPNRPGKYLIESWVEAIKPYDPIIGNFGNSPAFLYNNSEDDDSGVNKNFKYYLEVNKNAFVDNNGVFECPTYYNIGVGAKTACTFDFSLSYDSPLSNDDETCVMVEPSENFTQTPDSNYEYVDFELNDTRDIVLGTSDNYYHINNESGEIVYAHIKSANANMPNALSELNELGASLKTCNATKNYVDFIDEYAQYANSDGLYPLTTELKTFLIEFAEAQAYFNREYGWIGSNVSDDYTFSSNADFLYDCCYYTNIEKAA